MDTHRKAHVKTNQKSKITIKKQKTDKPLIIPVFIPGIACPHQCVFCNQPIITEKEAVIPDHTEIDAIISHYMKFKGTRKRVECAFFGGNFLGLPDNAILSLLDIIKAYVNEKIIHGIRFSTRPDTITKNKLSLIEPYPVSTVEIGVQSMNDKVLKISKRGHTAQDIINALELLKTLPVKTLPVKTPPLKTGIQLMVGLPGDDEESLIKSTKTIAEFSPDFARIYPVLVFKGTVLAHWYKQGRYSPTKLSEAVRLVKEMVKILSSANIEIIRTGLQATDTMEDPSLNLAGPWHPAFGHLVRSEIFYDMLCEKLDQYPAGPADIELAINPVSLPVLIGDRKSNMQKLKTRYPDYNFKIFKDETVAVQEIKTAQAIF